LGNVISVALVAVASPAHLTSSLMILTLRSRSSEVPLLMVTLTSMIMGTPPS